MPLTFVRQIIDNVVNDTIYNALPVSDNLTVDGAARANIDAFKNALEAKLLAASGGGGSILAAILAADNNAGGHQIQNLADPTGPQHAATMNYVDNTRIIDITYADLQTAKDADELIKGATYEITDRGDRGIFIQAISTNELSRTGIRKMLCPAFYGIGAGEGGNNWIGVWNATKNPDIGDLAIWGGLVFESLTGNIGTATTDILLDVVNWAVIPKASFSNFEYLEMQFSISYDLDNDWIDRQWDGKNNFVGYSFTTAGGARNSVDITDWNMETGGIAFYNNISPAGIFNNSTAGYIVNNMGDGVYNNSNTEGIYNNMNMGDIDSNSNTGNISYNFNQGDINSNSNGGHITHNDNSGHISSNSNVGNIQYNINNGDIQSCESGVNPCNIHHNINNGDISGTFAADVLDTIVDKS